MLEKTLRFNELYDFYQSLLTEKQHSYMSLYYLDDYSLSEIAEACNVSRQAVYDNIKRAEQLMEYYEGKLHLYEKYKRRKQLIQQLQQLANDDEDKSQLNEVILALEQLE